MVVCKKCGTYLVGIKRITVSGVEERYRCYCGYQSIAFTPRRRNESNKSEMHQ